MEAQTACMQCASDPSSYVRHATLCMGCATVSTSIFSDRSAGDGLIFQIYNGYFNDNVQWFSTVSSTNRGKTKKIEDINTGTNNILSVNGADSYSVQWIGFFKTSASGTWTFHTNSDDASYVWIGNNAVSSFTTANALINNGGLHPMRVVSGSISLESNTYYPIRIQFGENGGGDNCQFYWTPPGGTHTYNGASFFYSCPPDSTCNELVQYKNTFVDVHGFTVHRYQYNTTNSYNISFTQDTIADILLVGGGGSGLNGGGGAGAVIYYANYRFNASKTYSLAVGAGGSPTTIKDDLKVIFKAEAGGHAGQTGASGGGGACSSAAAGPNSTNIIAGLSGITLGYSGGNGSCLSATSGGGGGAGGPAFNQKGGSGVDGAWWTDSYHKFDNMFGHAYTSIAIDSHIAAGGEGCNTSPCSNPTSTTPGSGGPAGHAKNMGAAGLILLRYATCQPCPAGSYLSNEACVQCEAGKYSGWGKHKCTACPAGYTSNGSDTCEGPKTLTAAMLKVPIMHGWANISTTDFIGFQDGMLYWGLHPLIHARIWQGIGTIIAQSVGPTITSNQTNWLWTCSQQYKLQGTFFNQISQKQEPCPQDSYCP
jgi:hypothetical protein